MFPYPLQLSYFLVYFNDLMPERFGRTRKYALGKTSGKANIRKNLEELDSALPTEEQDVDALEVQELDHRLDGVLQLLEQVEPEPRYVSPLADLELLLMTTIVKVKQIAETRSIIENDGAMETRCRPLPARSGPLDFTSSR